MQRFCWECFGFRWRKSIPLFHCLTPLSSWVGESVLSFHVCFHEAQVMEAGGERFFAFKWHSRSDMNYWRLRTHGRLLKYFTSTVNFRTWLTKRCGSLPGPRWIFEFKLYNCDIHQTKWKTRIVLLSVVCCITCFLQQSPPKRWQLRPPAAPAAVAAALWSTPWGASLIFTANSAERQRHRQRRKKKNFEAFETICWMLTGQPSHSMLTEAAIVSSSTVLNNVKQLTCARLSCQWPSVFHAESPRTHAVTPSIPAALQDSQMLTAPQ